jgi:hypothetical protein
MKSFYILCCFSFVIGVISCKQEASTQQETTGSEASSQVSTLSQQVPNQAVEQPLTEGHDYTFLTDKILIYQVAFGGEKSGKEQPFKDEWIDLQPDGTFKAGKLKNQTHTGQWSYNNDSKTLFLRPDTREVKMSEWNVMYNNEMMVWAGTQTYGDNAIQIKLVRSEVLPE